MNELETQTLTGSTVYAIIRNSSNQVWSVTGSALVTFVDVNWNSYKVPLTEQGTSGYFSASFPAGITQADSYSVQFFKGSGSESDQFVTGGTINWNGTAATYTGSGTMLASLAYVKDYGNITVTTYDSYLTNRINAISVEISNLLNRAFPIATYTENYDGPGSTTLLLNHHPVTAVTSVTLDYYSTSPTVISGSEVIVNGNKGLLSVKPSSTYGKWFPHDSFSGQQGIQVIYSAGFSSIPLDIQEAVAKAVIGEYLRRGQDLSMLSERIGDYQYTRAAHVRTISDEILASVWHYKELVA